MKSIPPTPADSLIEARGLCVEQGGLRIVDQLDLDLLPGERLALRGPSGVGKTTLLMALMGFLPLHAGRLRMLGHALARPRDFDMLRGPVGFMFQNPDDQLFCPTVLDDVRFGPLNLGLDDAQATERAWDVLEALHIAELAQRPCAVLSGGQKRRVALAGLLAMQPRLLILDEPTASLDRHAAEQVEQALLDCGLPLLFTTHDDACEQALATRSVHMQAPCPAIVAAPQLHDVRRRA